MTSDTDPLARAEQRIEALKVEGEKHLTAMIGEAHEDGPRIGNWSRRSAC